MRFNTAQYLEKEVVTCSARNGNASTVIYDGQPIYFMSFDTATNFGVDALSYNETGAIASLAMGIAKWSKNVGNITAGAAAGDVFEAVCYGFTDAYVTVRTRAASTDNWVSNVGLVVGDQLIPETGGNNLSRQATLAASSAALAQFVAAQSVLSQTTATSNATHVIAATSGLIDYVRMKVFVRGM